MLTFHFTGADGSMTQAETLTSGMEGRQIRLELDSSWENLTKTAVFRAGAITRVVMDPGTAVTIPAEVLERPYVKLLVGLYGTDADGKLVIPTVMAEGPLIEPGAAPTEDGSAKDLPVWKNLQSQINNLAYRLEDLNCAAFPEEAGQLLISILRCGSFSPDQTAQIDALADALGVAEPEDLSHLTHHWDFRTGSLTDRIGGLEADASADVLLDDRGAHLNTATSYIMFPVDAAGAPLAGHTAEIKFGGMALAEDAGTMRLLTACTGSQPAATGLQWSVMDCWTTKSSLDTEFTDLQMFSGKTLVVKATASLLEWYIDGRLIASLEPTVDYTHLSVGSTASGAYPLTVEYVRIYPNS